MKKLVALLTVLLLLASACFAEELPYIRCYKQYKLSDLTLLTDESYPEVRLMPSASSWWYYGRSASDPLFLCFSGPDGASPFSFHSDSARFWDGDGLIYYDYKLQDSNSFEEFMNKASRDEYILLDGTGGVSAYIEPNSNYPEAYGLIAAKDFGKSAKLWIRVMLARRSKQIPYEERVEFLTNAITTEVTRVQSQMRTERLSPWWSYGKYAGVKIADKDYLKLITYTFPKIEVRVKETGLMQAAMSVTDVRESSFSGIYGFEDKAYVEFSAGLDTNSYALSKLEEHDADAEKVTLESGSEWTVYFSNKSDDGSIYRWLASRLIDGLLDWEGKPYYLSVTFSAASSDWENKDACRDTLAKVDSMFQVCVPEDDPCTLPGKTVQTENTAVVSEAGNGMEPSAEPADTASGAEGDEPQAWTCENGHEGNTGKFCIECGAPKPVPADSDGTWTCENGHEGNTGKFCPECGAPRTRVG